MAQDEIRLVEYNCENLFDTRHDSLRNDSEFLPDGIRQWDFGKYWKKLNDIGRAILQCGGRGDDWRLPDVVALTEVENDSVLHGLTHRSVLRGSGYRYIITDSPDERGVDVALMYNPMTVRLLSHRAIRVPRASGQRPTRDILHCQMMTRTDDTLHVFVVHAPSRRGGKGRTEKHRMAVARTLMEHTDSLRRLSPEARIVIAGDFNDYCHDRALRYMHEHGFTDVSVEAVGLHHPTEVTGTYCFGGEWNSLDHVMLSQELEAASCYVYDADWLLETTPQGSLRPLRTYLGTHYHGGVSDHLPLVVTIKGMTP